MFRGFLLTSVVVGGLCATSTLAHEVDNAKQQAMALTLFEKACLKTYPGFQGAEAVFEKNGLKPTNDGGWKGASLYGRVSKKNCFVANPFTDPTGIGPSVGKALARSQVQSSDVKVKGRKVLGNVTIKGVTGFLFIKPIWPPGTTTPKHHKNVPAISLSLNNYTK